MSISSLAQLLVAAYGFANAVKTQSNNHDCGVVHGVEETVKYVYSSSGNNCDTTAERDTIQCALGKAFRNFQGVGLN